MSTVGQTGCVTRISGGVTQEPMTWIVGELIRCVLKIHPSWQPATAIIVMQHSTATTPTAKATTTMATAMSHGTALSVPTRRTASTRARTQTTAHVTSRRGARRTRTILTVGRLQLHPHHRQQAQVVVIHSSGSVTRVRAFQLAVDAMGPRCGAMLRGQQIAQTTVTKARLVVWKASGILSSAQLERDQGPHLVHAWMRQKYTAFS